MPGFSHTISTNWGNGALTATATKESDTEQNVSVSIANNTAAFALGLDWAAGKLNDLFIKVSRPCTLKINNSGAPTDTIPLSPDAPFTWVRGSGAGEPFVGTAGAVTAAFITVPDDLPLGACDFELRSGVDL